MIALTLLYLVLPIISATPTLPHLPVPPGPPAPSHSVKTGGGACVDLYGEGISLPDCHLALDQMRHHLDSLPGNERYVGPFSSFTNNPLFRLPRIWRTPTCTIGLEIKDDRIFVPANWDTRVKAAAGIVQQCVLAHGMGGEWHSEEYFLTIVVNEQTMSPDLRPRWTRCLRAMGAVGTSGMPDTPDPSCENFLEQALAMMRSNPSMAYTIQ